MPDCEKAFCPSCGKIDIKEDVCDSCGFSLGTILHCPQKQTNGNCSKTKTPCSIEDMSWEVCEFMRTEEK